MNQPPTPFGAILLAGGRSTRMGRDKAALPFGPRLLWEHQLHTLQATGPAEIFISGPASGPYLNAGYPILEDESSGAGPLSGILSGLRHVSHPYLLVLAIDLPEITPDFLQSLLAEAHSVERGIVTRDTRWWEPLAAVYPRTLLPLAEASIAQKHLSLQAFIRRGVELGLLNSRELGPAETPLFRNLNSPADLQT